MGDRAVLYIEGASAAVYLHWGGSDVMELLQAAAPTMRPNDPNYATARLIAAACKLNQPPTGVGVLRPPADLGVETLRKYSHGDAGVFLLPASSGPVRCVGGYGLPPNEYGEHDRNDLRTSNVVLTYGGGR